MKRSGKRRGSAVLIRFMLMIMGLFAGNFFRTIPAFAAEPGDPGQEVWTQDAGSTALDLSEIENYLDRIGEQKTAGMTFGELMNMIQAGDMEKIFLYGRDRIASALFSEIRTNASFLAEILILSLCGAACSGFFGIFGSGQLSETGFYVICICVQTFLAAGFFSSIRIAEETTGEILGFMKVLLPAYFLAVTMAGGAVTSASVCGFTIGAIGVIQTVVSRIPSAGHETLHGDFPGRKSVPGGDVLGDDGASGKGCGGGR